MGMKGLDEKLPKILRQFSLPWIIKKRSQTMNNPQEIKNCQFV